jgi:hypothetical protein
MLNMETVCQNTLYYPIQGLCVSPRMLNMETVRQNTLYHPIQGLCVVPQMLNMETLRQNTLYHPIQELCVAPQMLNMETVRQNTLYHPIQGLCVAPQMLNMETVRQNTPYHPIQGLCVAPQMLNKQHICRHRSMGLAIPVMQCVLIVFLTGVCLSVYSRSYTGSASGHWSLRFGNCTVWDLLSGGPIDRGTPYLQRSPQSQSHDMTDGQSDRQTDGQSDRQTDSVSWCRVPSGSHDHLFLAVGLLLLCLYGMPSLTRGRVCRLSVRVCILSLLYFLCRPSPCPM